MSRKTFTTCHPPLSKGSPIGGHDGHTRAAGGYRSCQRGQSAELRVHDDEDDWEAPARMWDILHRAGRDQRNWNAATTGSQVQSTGRGVRFQDRTAFRSKRFVLVAIKQSNQEKPHVYRPSILTFVDILGFREIARKGKPEDIKELLESLKREATPDDNLAKDLEMSFLTFSDCTVRVVPVDSRSNKKFPSGILWHELLSLVYLQARLVRKKCFIRGGLTVDDIYIDGNMVFGPAIIKAYMLESEFAVYPRIVVDPAVFPLFEKDQLLRNHDTATEWKYLQKVIRRDSDGLYFVGLHFRYSYRVRRGGYGV